MTYAACILWTVLMAVWSAVDDAEQIAAGERLNKALQWCVRAFGVTAFCVACGLWWMALPMGALFSSVFRFALNRLRGLDWRYVSPSSWYDWMFIWIASIPGRGLYVHAIWNNRARLEMAAQWGTIGYHAGWPPYVKWAHRAGLLAYIAELAFAVLIFVLFV